MTWCYEKVLVTEKCLIKSDIAKFATGSNFFCRGYGNFKGMGNLSHSYTWDLCQLMKYFGELCIGPDVLTLSLNN